MQIRNATTSDLNLLDEIDGTIESSEYLHLDRIGEGLTLGWQLAKRPLRTKLIQRNAIDGDLEFTIKQIVSGNDEGFVLVAEHGDAPVALAVAKPDHDAGTMRLIDLRVDFDVRRQGIATVMVYQLIQHAKDSGLRALSVETRTNNMPASQLLQKLSLEITGVDTHRRSNHDLVKEMATLFWYAALD